MPTAGLPESGSELVRLDPSNGLQFSRLGMIFALYSLRHSCVYSRSVAVAIRGVRHRPFHQAASARAGARLGPHEPPKSSAHIASDRRATAEPALCRHRGRHRVRRSRKTRRLRALRSPRTCSTACKRSYPGEFRAPRHSSGRTQTSRCAPSCAASPVVEASQAAGRKAGASTTRTTTAAQAVARSTSRRQDWKGCSPTNWHYCNRHLATCGY